MLRSRYVKGEDEEDWPDSPLWPDPAHVEPTSAQLTLDLIDQMMEEVQLLKSQVMSASHRKQLQRKSGSQPPHLQPSPQKLNRDSYPPTPQQLPSQYQPAAKPPRVAASTSQQLPSQNQPASHSKSLSVAVSTSQKLPSQYQPAYQSFYVAVSTEQQLLAQYQPASQPLPIKATSYISTYSDQQLLHHHQPVLAQSLPPRVLSHAATYTPRQPEYNPVSMTQASWRQRQGQQHTVPPNDLAVKAKRILHTEEVGVTPYVTPLLHKGALPLLHAPRELSPFLAPKETVRLPSLWSTVHSMKIQELVDAGASTKLNPESSQGQVLLSFPLPQSSATLKQPLSMPRLELCGAVTGAQLAKLIENNLIENSLTLKIDLTIQWIDSTMVLTGRQSVSSRFKIFITTRVAEIQQLTSPHLWHYIESARNLPDNSTRARTLKDIVNANSRSQASPSLIHTTDKFPVKLNVGHNDNTSELQNATFFGVTLTTPSTLDTEVKQYDTWRELPEATVQELHGAADQSSSRTAIGYRNAKDFKHSAVHPIVWDPGRFIIQQLGFVSSSLTDLEPLKPVLFMGRPSDRVSRDKTTSCHTFLRQIVRH